METSEPGNVIDELAIERVMEDVGLKPVNLNGEVGDSTDDLALACEVSSASLTREDIPDNQFNGLYAVHNKGDQNNCLAPEEASIESAEDGEDEDMQETEGIEDIYQSQEKNDIIGRKCSSEDEGTSNSSMPKKESSLRDLSKTTDNPSSDAAMEVLEEGVLGHNDKGDQNQNKLQGTPAALRRSSRTKLPTSPAPHDTPSSVGRTTRSQINPEIIAKQKSFMHKYQMAVKSSMDSYVRSAASENEVKTEQPIKRKWEDTGGLDAVCSPHSSPVQEKKSRKSIASIPSTKGNNHSVEVQTKKIARHDTFCWTCHVDGQVLECRQCPRVFHQRCVQIQSPVPPKWICPECVSIRNADKHSQADIDQLPDMLNFAMERIKSVTDSQPFFKPVDTEEFPQYTEYIVCPVDISQLEEKIAQKHYNSTRAFLADFRWILHNCIIFNSFHSKLTSTARTLMKVCKHEMAEIDTCADCYIHAHTKRETWFLEPCRRPHLLLWAKLKGFPHWPAKAMKANKEGNVDVRFFGAHDRAWVPAKDCYLYSREMPMQVKNQRKANLISSIEEVDQHIKKLVERYGSFAYPSPRTAYNPHKEVEQLQMLIPGYKVEESEQSLLNKDEHMGEVGDAESMQSDSDTGESADNEPSSQTPPREGDRPEEGRNFMAMLQLAPRNSAELTTHAADNSTPTSESPIPSQTLTPVANESKPSATSSTSNIATKPQNKNSKVNRVSLPKTNCTDNVLEPASQNSSVPINDDSNNDNSNDTKLTKACVTSLPQRVSTSKELLSVKTEPVDEVIDDEASLAQESASCNISLTIDTVVGNYNSVSSIKSKTDSTPKSNHKAVVKQSVSKPSVTKTSTPKTAAPKSTPKFLSNRPPTTKSTPVAKANAKSVPTNRRVLGDDEEDLDPAMYLDPTITITLINNEEKKAVNKTINDVNTSSISSSDLQALNALGENVSITVVPKRKGGSTGITSVRSKENEAIEQPMVIEVDPVALQKARAPAPVAKARKSFPSKPRQANHSVQQKFSQKTSTPPMVSIPSRHLGMEITRSTPSTQQTSSVRIPSITVRPVTQLPAQQPSIILQSGPSETAPISSITSTVKQANATSTTAAGNSNNSSTLTLNTMHTVGPESGFGTGGLLLTFNRSVPAFSASTTPTTLSSAPVAVQNKKDSGSLSAQLSSRTQQIADMVRTTIETLMQEMSSAGNLETTIVQLQLELERCRTQHQQEIAELKRTIEAQQASAESEKQRALAELRKQLDAEKQRTIEEIKKKQWCAHCSQEAIFYCCWNTAYCDYPCQQSHWPKHMATCANANQNTDADQTEAETISTVAEIPRSPSPQKSTPTVNGSPGQGRRTNSVSKISQIASSNDVGYAVLTPSCVAVSGTLVPSSSDAVAVRVGQAITGAE